MDRLDFISGKPKPATIFEENMGNGQYVLSLMYSGRKILSTESMNVITSNGKITSRALRFKNRSQMIEAVNNLCDHVEDGNG